MVSKESSLDVWCNYTGYLLIEDSKNVFNVLRMFPRDATIQKPHHHVIICWSLWSQNVWHSNFISCATKFQFSFHFLQRASQIKQFTSCIVQTLSVVVCIYVWLPNINDCCLLYCDSHKIMISTILFNNLWLLGQASHFTKCSLWLRQWCSRRGGFFSRSVTWIYFSLFMQTGQSMSWEG